MSNLCILLHTKRMQDFVSLLANFCHLLLSLVGYFDVFPYASFRLRRKSSPDRFHSLADSRLKVTNAMQTAVYVHVILLIPPVIVLIQAVLLIPHFRLQTKAHRSSSIHLLTAVRKEQMQCICCSNPTSYCTNPGSYLFY